MQKKTKQLPYVYSKEEWKALIERVLGRPSNKYGYYEGSVWLTPHDPAAKVRVEVINNPGRVLLALAVELRELKPINLGGFGMARSSEWTGAWTVVKSKAALRKLTPERAYELLVPHKPEEAPLFPPHRALFVRTIRRFLAKV
jgi:hypothetical protein